MVPDYFPEFLFPRKASAGIRTTVDHRLETIFTASS